MWFLSYLAANFALIAVVALAVLVLGAIAWFTKNWKEAVAAVAILAAGFAYMQIDKNAYQRRVFEEAQQQVRVLQGRLDTIDMASQADADRALADATTNQKLRNLAGQTPANSAACLDSDAAKRVGDIK